MKKMLSKKGFTIVELVIVIAVIAILAAVLIPTFSGVVEKAKESSNLQAAENALKVALIDDDFDGEMPSGTIFEVTDGSEKIYYTFTNSALVLQTTNPTLGTEYTVTNIPSSVKVYHPAS